MVIWRSSVTYAYDDVKGKYHFTLRLWGQSVDRLIKRSAIEDAWEECKAGAKAYDSNFAGIIDELQPAPGIEPNMEIESSEVERALGVWYGKLIVRSRTEVRAPYEYNVFERKIREDEYEECQLTRGDIGGIETRLKEIKDNLDNIYYVEQLIREIDDLLVKRGCTRFNIAYLIERYGLENVIKLY